MKTRPTRILRLALVFGAAATVAFGLYPPLRNAVAAELAPAQTVSLDATMCKTIEGGPEQHSATYYVYASGAGPWRLRCGEIHRVFRPGSSGTFTGLRAYARPRANKDCQATGSGPSLQATLYTRNPFNGSPRNTSHTCNIAWSNTTWLTCADLDSRSVSYGATAYVEFYTSRGDCWDISGAIAYYEP
jgi:hypothetical protein